MATNQLDMIMTQVQQLPPSDQMQLLQRVMGLLTKSKAATPSRGLVYGKYRNAPGTMSIEEDFNLSGEHSAEDFAASRHLNLDLGFNPRGGSEMSPHRVSDG